MEYRSGLIPLAVSPSAPARPIASRTKFLLEAPILPTLLWLVAATTIIGCSDALLSPGGAKHYASAGRSNRDSYEVPVRDIEHAGRVSYGALLKAHEHGKPRALRVKVDNARNRLWVLSLEHVYVYDTIGRQLIRRVALPAWSVARSICSPDMTLDRSGAAFISSNVESKLWKIDAEDFSIKEHEIRLRAREDLDIGFGALTFAADGTLFALTAHAGSLWRIDIANSSANEVELSERVLNTCTLNTPRETVQGAQQRAVVLCAAAENDSRRIVISPDLTRGHVSNEKCPS
jgi:hypothetical protein